MMESAHSLTEKEAAPQTAAERRALGLWGDGLFARVFDYINEGILAIEGGLILDANRGAAQVLGLSKADLIGQRLSRFFVPEQRLEFERLLRQVQTRSSGAECGVFSMRDAQNQSLVVEGSLTGDPRSERMVYFFKDMTQFRQEGVQREKYMAEILKAKQEAEDSEQLKNHFISNVTHELRTPLHAVLSFAQKGIEKAHRLPPERLRTYFEQIRSSGDRLLDLVNELLDFSKMREGRYRYDKRPTDLAALIESVAGELAGLAEAKGVKLEINLASDLRRSTVDPKMLRRVWVNLLANALRFSPKGGTIKWGLDWDPEQEGMLRVSVADQGPGLPPEELERIFEAFTQSSRTQSGAGGTGLGLCISKEIVAEHGGQIWVENRPQGGAQFNVRLPVVPQLGELLLAKGMITDENLHQALVEQKQLKYHRGPGSKGVQ